MWMRNEWGGKLAFGRHEDETETGWENLQVFYCNGNGNCW